MRSGGLIVVWPWHLFRLKPEKRVRPGDAAGQSTNLPAPAGHIGHRRELCWWEPIYGPGLTLELEHFDWAQDRDAGPCRRLITGSSLKEMVTAGDTFPIKSLTFRQCDFQGTFDPGTIVMFDRCRFFECDFAYSNWKDAHFRACEFDQCSISLASFERCEFRACQWRRIGLGSKTDLTRTFIENPGALNRSAISLTEPSNKTRRHKAYQWYRLQGTRAHFLRTLMLSHQRTGDEHTYYETVGLHELQRSKARIAKDLYDIAFSSKGKKIKASASFALHGADSIILRTLGWLNKWGESASRPFFALLACYGLFFVLYSRLHFKKPIAYPAQKVLT